MAFVCKFQLNNGAITDSDEIIFVKYIEKSFGNFFPTPVPIAEIIINGKSEFIYSTCPCFPSTKRNLLKNQLINSETIIGYFSAEGEDIPYNRPYAIIAK